MSAITISRQTGSQGDELAVQVAQRLGWRWVGRDIINRAALVAGVPQVALAEIDELGFFGLRPSAKERQLYQGQVERIIRDLADEGSVIIVGRGSQVVLGQRSDVLRVRVIAPLAVRIAWLQQQRPISVESARAWLAASDKARARYLRRGYGVQVDDPALYHLVINTGALDLTLAVDLVVHTIQAWNESKGEEKEMPVL